MPERRASSEVARIAVEIPGISGLRGVGLEERQKIGIDDFRVCRVLGQLCLSAVSTESEARCIFSKWQPLWFFWHRSALSLTDIAHCGATRGKAFT